MTALNLPAFRVAVGDTVTHERRRYTVTHVGHTVTYPNRIAEAAGATKRNGVRLTLRAQRRIGGLTTATFDNFDTVRTVRAERTAA